MQDVYLYFYSVLLSKGAEYFFQHCTVVSIFIVLEFYKVKTEAYILLEISSEVLREPSLK